MRMFARLNRYQRQALGLLRIMSGLLFLEHGTQKLLSFPPGQMAGAAWSGTMPGYAGFIECAAGLLITIGLLTRPAAFLASGTMAVAYFLVHAPKGPFPVNNMGETPILFCFVFLYLAIAGPGAWSVDHR
jgi:putative oxidoreductase